MFLAKPADRIPGMAVDKLQGKAWAQLLAWYQDGMPRKPWVEPQVLTLDVAQPKGGQGRALFYIRLAPHPLLPEKLNGTLVPMGETARIARVNDLKGQGYRYLVRV